MSGYYVDYGFHGDDSGVVNPVNHFLFGRMNFGSFICFHYNVDMGKYL